MDDIGRRIYRAGLVLLIGFVLVSAMAAYWKVVRADDLASDPTIDRGRMFLEEQRVDRGRILDRNGAVLAENRVQPDGSVRRVSTDPSLAQVVGYHSDRYGDGGMEAAGAGVLTGLTGAAAVSGFVQDLLHVPRKGGD